MTGEDLSDKATEYITALFRDNADGHKLFHTEHNANARAFLRENSVPEDRPDR